MLKDKVSGLGKGVARLGLAHRRKNVPPGEGILAQELGLAPEIAPEHGQGIVHGAQHGLEGGAVDTRLVEGLVQGIRATPAGVEQSLGTLDAVHAGGQGLFDRLPRSQFRFIGPAAHTGIGVGPPQVLEDGDGQRLCLALVLELNLDLRGDDALEIAPGTDAAERQFGRQGLLRLAHQVLALLRGLLQIEGVPGYGSRLGLQGLKQAGLPGDRSDPALEQGLLLF